MNSKIKTSPSQDHSVAYPDDLSLMYPNVPVILKMSKESVNVVPVNEYNEKGLVTEMTPRLVTRHICRLDPMALYKRMREATGNDRSYRLDEVLLSSVKDSKVVN